MPPIGPDGKNDNRRVVTYGVEDVGKMGHGRAIQKPGLNIKLDEDAQGFLKVYDVPRMLECCGLFRIDASSGD